MSAFFNTIFRAVSGFLSSKGRRRIIPIFIISIIALVDFLNLGLARRTFVFYTVGNGEIVVEDRMLRKTAWRETDITRYTEEVLLGPAAHDLLPLFPRGTRLNSLLYRNGVVFADFSADAALPPLEGGRTLENFRTLREGILRNFSSVKDVRFFIEGRAAFSDEFPPFSASDA